MCWVLKSVLLLQMFLFLHSFTFIFTDTSLAWWLKEMIQLYTCNSQLPEIIFGAIGQMFLMLSLLGTFWDYFLVHWGSSTCSMCQRSWVTAVARASCWLSREPILWQLNLFLKKTRKFQGHFSILTILSLGWMTAWLNC